MARAYHNLRGLRNDIERALREGDYGEVTLLLELLDDVADARDGIEHDTGLEETSDDSLQLVEDELAVRERERRPTVGGLAPGYGPVRQPLVGGLPGMELEVVHHDRATSLAEGAARGTAAVVRTTPGVATRLVKGGS